jgi:glycosyltransferase involved in cell wall biosynthesis
MRVLLLADECNPGWASLPVVGFKLCRAIADHVDVVVATHVRNRPNITQTGFGRARVEYIDNEYVAAPLYRLARFLRRGDKVAWTANVALAYPSALAFEYEAWRKFGGALSRGEFDIVHRVTPMSPTIPSPMASWSPVPFVIGPLNGGLRWPAQFISELHREREWLTYVRGASRLLPYHRSTYDRAAAILAAFDHTAADLPAAARERVIKCPEVGIDPEMFVAPRGRSVHARVTFLFVGRLVPLKCVDVLVRAFASSETLRKHRLVIVGDGPERSRLESMIREYQLESCVELVGWKSQAEVGDIMRAADVFAFPSIRELGAGVVVEAMACGLPCVVVDYGGPGGLISETTGIKVKLGDKAWLEREFARELEQLALAPDRRVNLGRAAAQHAVTEYGWDAKARKIVHVYEWVLGRADRKPGLHATTQRVDQRAPTTCSQSS